MDVWRWLANGLGGMVGMLGRQDADPTAPAMTPEQIKKVEGYLATLDEILRSQREKADRGCEPDRPGADDR